MSHLDVLCASMIHGITESCPLTAAMPLTMTGHGAFAGIAAWLQNDRGHPGHGSTHAP